MGENKEKFSWNKKYLTICMYAILFVLASVLIIKAIMGWGSTVAHFKSLISVVAPFLWGAFIAFLINPLVKFFDKSVFGKIKGIRSSEKARKGLSMTISYILVILIIVLVFLYLIPQIASSISEIITQAPKWYEQANEWLYEFEEDHPQFDYDSINEYIEDLIPWFNEYSKTIVTGIVPFIFTTSWSVVKVVINIFIAIMVSIYIIADKKILSTGFKRVLYGLLPTKTCDVIMDTIRECNHIFSQFIFGKAVDSFVIGCLCFITMTIFQFPFAPIISLIVGITNMIPYFGPFVGAIPGVIFIFMVNPLQAVFFTIMIIVLQQLDGLLLGPRILGETVGLRPLWIIFAITVGGSTGGVVGMFLGVPIVAVLSYLLEKLLNRLDRKRKAKLIMEKALQEREEGTEEIVGQTRADDINQ